MFIWGKGSGIYVDIRVDLDGCDAHSPRFQDRTDTAGDDPLPNATDDTACDKDVLHGDTCQSSPHNADSSKLHLAAETGSDFAGMKVQLYKRAATCGNNYLQMTNFCVPFDMWAIII